MFSKVIVLLEYFDLFYAKNYASMHDRPVTEKNDILELNNHLINIPLPSVIWEIFM